MLNVWPLLTAAGLIVMVAIWLGMKIPGGILTYQDELFTAERAREMLILGRDSVYYNFQHSFAKPPLQYWLTTFTLPRLANSATAVRIWPLIFGVLTAIAVGWIAFLMTATSKNQSLFRRDAETKTRDACAPQIRRLHVDAFQSSVVAHDQDELDRPKRPWLVPLSVAIFVSCPLFSTETTRALLDTGLMFFTTMAIGFAELARRRSEWWIGVAIACWLGALQKIPLIFLIWIIIAVVRFSGKTGSARAEIRWLVASVLISIALVSIWPVFQYVRFGMPVTRAFAGDDLDALFGERRLGSRPFFEIPAALLATGWAGGAFVLGAAVAFLFWKKSDVPPLIREMSILSLVVIFLALVFGFRSARYVLPIIPCLCVVLAYFLHVLAERNRSVRFATIAFICLFVIGGFAQAEIKMHHRGPDASRERRVAEELGKIQGADAATLLVNPGAPAKKVLRSNAFYLFHGKLMHRVQRYSLERLRKSPPPAPVVGVCVVRDLAAVQSIYPDASPVFALDQFICWRAER